MGRELYRFTKGAKEDLLALQYGLSYSQIIERVKRAIIIDHPAGNYVEGDTIYKVTDGGVIEAVSLRHLNRPARMHVFKCIICFDAKKINVGDPCELCATTGCGSCDEGLVFKLITCPNCVNLKIEDRRNEWENRIGIEREQSHGIGRPVPRQRTRNKRRKTSGRNNGPL